MVRRPLALVLCAACQEYDVTSSRVEDTFVQVDQEARADVLFVVDDSSSMAEEQARLADNFLGFLEVLEGSAADFHLGVVTTSIADDGLLRGELATPETPDLVGVVYEALLVGTEGDREEQGLEAAQRALDGRNPGFPRPDARLNLVFVSDEDDWSPDPASDYLAGWREGAVAGLGVHGIVGDLPDGCATGTSAAEAGPRYIEVITATAGHRASICSDDYTALLRDVGLDVAGLPDTFALSRFPRVDTLEVRVDDVLLHERDVDGWTWSPGENAIVLHGRAVPRPGMTVLASYEPDLALD